MSPSRTTGLLVLVGALLAAAAFLMLSGDPSAPGTFGGTTDEPLTGAKDVSAAEATLTGDTTHERTEVDLSDADITAALARIPEVPLQLTGRVTDAIGNPIGGAEVRIQHRQDFMAVFAAAGNGPGGGRGNFGGRGRGGRGNFDRNAMRERFRSKDVAEPVKTNANGTYSLRGEAWAAADLTIAVRHDQYAPAVSRRTWSQEEGDVTIEDIVLSDGVRVTGAVIDENEQPVAGAEVQWQRSQDDPFGFGGGGRGGRGGGRGGRGGFRGNPLADLIAPAVTDSVGAFSLGPVPVDSFELRAEAEGHLDGQSRRLQPKDGEPLPEQRIVLHTAAQLTGVVHDAQGNPVEGARVSAETSREAIFARMRNERDAQRADRDALRAQGIEPQQQPRGRGGRGGQAGGRGQRGDSGMRSVMDATDRTRTDEKGEFALTQVPPVEVRITVEHDAFLTEVQEPIDASRTAFVDVSMRSALSFSGQVVDAQGGAPVENFGISARRVDGGGGGPGNFGRGGQNGQDGRGQQFGGRGQPAGGRGQRGGGRGADNQAQPQVPDPAEVVRQAWLKERLGPSGQMPRRTPEPTAHPGGAFQLGELQPGDYVFDISAPGYVRIAAGVFSVDEQTGPINGLVVHVQRGTELRGVVQLRDGTPVADARVELMLPDPPGTTPDNNANNAMGGMFGMGRGGRGRGQQLARATTDAEGLFSLDPQRPGTFRLRVSAADLMDYDNPKLVLPADKTLHEVRVVMTEGGTLFGVVHNRETGSRARVQVTNAETREREFGSVDPISGEYEITGLKPGGYFATLVQGGGRGGRGGGGGQNDDARRTMLANAIALGERVDPDVHVADGAKVRYDLTVGQDALGSLDGMVWLNGQPGTGMQVRLNKISTDPTANQNPTGGRNRGGGGRGGRGGGTDLNSMVAQLLRADVAVDGSFSIAAIPPGDYELQVSSARGGGGRGGRGGRQRGGRGNTMHRELLQIAPYLQASVRVEILTAQVEMKVTTADGQPGSRLRVGIVLASEGAGQDPQQWRRLSSYRGLFLRDGTTGPQDVKPGNYLYTVSGRGIKTVTGELFVAPGPLQTVQVMVEAAEEVQGGTGPGQGGGGRGGQAQPGQPGTQRGQGGGGRQGGQGGGRQGGGRGR